MKVHQPTLYTYVYVIIRAIYDGDTPEEEIIHATIDLGQARRVRDHAARHGREPCVVAASDEDAQRLIDQNISHVRTTVFYDPVITEGAAV